MVNRESVPPFLGRLSLVSKMGGEGICLGQGGECLLLPLFLFLCRRRRSFSAKKEG